MATKRQKKTVITGVTREAAEEAFGIYAKTDAQIEKINAEIDNHFRVITGNEHASAHLKIESHKAPFAENILQRLA